MKFRLSQWIDTSPESMAKNDADIWYGIQARIAPRKWVHVYEHGEALCFRTPEEAIAKIEAIEAEEKEARSKQGREP